MKQPQPKPIKVEKGSPLYCDGEVDDSPLTPVGGSTSESSSVTPHLQRAYDFYKANYRDPSTARLSALHQTVRGALMALKARDVVTAQVQLKIAEDVLLALLEKTIEEEGA